MKSKESFAQGYEHGIRIGFQFAASRFMQPIENTNQFEEMVEMAVEHLWLEFHGEKKDD
jgi:hypothetical protein